MNILYIHQYFKTPDIPGGTRSYWNSLELIKEGHRVTVIRSDSNLKTAREVGEVDGIKLITIQTDYSQSMGVIDRAKAFFRFMFAATREAMKLKDIDLVIATSTPLTVGYPALRLKAQRRIPFVFEVRDLWPEVPIQMGGLTNPVAIKLARWFEKRIYQKAEHIIALSPGMRQGVIDAGIPAVKTSMIPNMAKIDKFYSRPYNPEVFEKHGLRPDSFKVIYFGALGLANAIEYVMDGLSLLKGEGIDVLFIGSGPKSKYIEQRIQQDGLDYIRYLGVFNMEATSELVNICDVSLVTFTDLPILATNSPNKLFDSLSAGKPIIVNSPGWTKDLVEDYNCGLYADAKNPGDLAEKIRYLRDHPEVAERFGKNARKLAETKYDKSILCKEFVAVINEVGRRLNL